MDNYKKLLHRLNLLKRSQDEAKLVLNIDLLVAICVLFITALSLIFTVTGQRDSEKGNERIIEAVKGHHGETSISNDHLKKLVELQQGMLNNYREAEQKSLRPSAGGPPRAEPALVPKPPADPALLTRLEVTPNQERPRNFDASLVYYKLPPGHTWWLCVSSGLQVWPACELRPDPPGSQPRRQVVSVPPDVYSGAILLVEAGPEATHIFKNRPVYEQYDVGLFALHLPSDFKVAASVDFQILPTLPAKEKPHASSYR